ncbi:hypothetical protein [Kordiimonas sp.]|uniref:hypothetical protein n=1 Tax=Kordiimonas sp. TaxID=1970157 RepID=UPI003A8D7F50
MKNILAFVAALIGLGAAAYWAMYVFGKIDGVTLSGHGVAAMVIGLVLTLVVGFGLMALLFFSNKHGHDDEVHNLSQNVSDREKD